MNVGRWISRPGAAQLLKLITNWLIPTHVLGSPLRTATQLKQLQLPTASSLLHLYYNNLLINHIVFRHCFYYRSMYCVLGIFRLFAPFLFRFNSFGEIPPDSYLIDCTHIVCWSTKPKPKICNAPSSFNHILMIDKQQLQCLKFKKKSGNVQRT